MQTFQLNQLNTIQASRDAIFLYPTDSLYGLGAIPTKENTEKIDTIKQRLANKHFSLIAPSFQRIQEYFEVDEAIANKWTRRGETYGPITVLCKRRDPGFLSWVSSNEYIGIRYLGNHPMQVFVTKLGEPFLSTSANISGIEYSSAVLPSPFETLVDYFIVSERAMTEQRSKLLQYDTGEALMAH